MPPPLSASSSTAGVLAILLAALLWGSTGTAASFAPQANPMAIGAFAMGIGGLLQALLAYPHLLRQWQQLRQYPVLIMMGALAVAVYPLAFYSAMRLAGVTVGTVVTIASAPLATAIIERLFGTTNPMNRRWYSSLLAGTVGIVLLTQPVSGVVDTSGLAQNQDQNHLTGVFLGLLAGVTYALYSWLAANLIRQGIRSEAAMAALFLPATALLLLSLLWTADQLFADRSGTLAIVYITLVPMWLGYLAFGYGLRHIDAARATLLTLFEPVVAAVLAVWVVGEQLAWSGWLGIALIGVCLAIQTTAGRR